MHSRWLMVSLVVSVAVNLALAGFVVGRMSMPGPVPTTLDPSLSMFRVLHALPEPRREALRPVVREHFVSLRGDLHRMRDAQEQINSALATQPLDEEALSAALAGFRAALLDSQQANHRVLVRVAGNMTPEERLLLREFMSRPPHRGHVRIHKHREDSRER